MSRGSRAKNDISRVKKKLKKFTGKIFQIFLIPVAVEINMIKESFSVFCVYMILGCVRLMVALRYRVFVKGLDKIKSDVLKGSGGILFLPNHPAEIDPVLLEMVLWPKFQTRPLVVENFYRLKGFPEVLFSLPTKRSSKKSSPFFYRIKGFLKRDTFPHPFLKGNNHFF